MIKNIRKKTNFYLGGVKSRNGGGNRSPLFQNSWNFEERNTQNLHNNKNKIKIFFFK